MSHMAIRASRVCLFRKIYISNLTEGKAMGPEEALEVLGTFDALFFYRNYRLTGEK